MAVDRARRCSICLIVGAVLDGRRRRGGAEVYAEGVAFADCLSDTDGRDVGSALELGSYRINVTILVF